jgi:hypothetical protein
MPLTTCALMQVSPLLFKLATFVDLLIVFALLRIQRV